jgi:CHAT domain-containing protein
MTLLMNSRGPEHAAEVDANFRAAAATLSAVAIAPILPGLHARRLLIVPDGALLATPFAALPLPGGGPLLERFEIVTVPSAAALLALRRGDNRSAARPRRLAVIADPVFDSGDPRVHAAMALRPAPRGSFGRLLFSRREALSIASLMPAGASKVLLGFEAVKSSLTDGALAGYNILHISTHGILDFDRPERSALLFSQVRPDGSPRDGKLSLGELYGLHLDADLVSLSACQTGFGKEVIGEGAMSLSYGFLYAGARRVMASLWPVDDEATAELLGGFYGQWLRSPGESASAVLRQGQLALRRDRRWRSPYYWASLVLQGQP